MKERFGKVIVIERVYVNDFLNVSLVYYDKDIVGFWRFYDILEVYYWGLKVLNVEFIIYEGIVVFVIISKLLEGVWL